MNIHLSSDAYKNGIAVIELSWDEVEQLMDGATVESKFTNPKVFMRIVESTLQQRLNEYPRGTKLVQKSFQNENSASTSRE